LTVVGGAPTDLRAMVAKPTPAGTRAVLCHHCNRQIDVSVGAMTVNCRHCNRRVVLEDLKIKAYHAAVRVETAGKIEVLRKAHVVAEIRGNVLDVLGKVKGKMTCVGPIHLGKKAETEGDISCRSMVVEAGATLEGFVRIDPAFTPQADAGTSEDDGLLREDAAELTRTGEIQPRPAPRIDDDGEDDEVESLLRPELRKKTARKKAARKKAKKKARKKTPGKSPASGATDAAEPAE